MALLQQRMDWLERRIIELERTLQESIGLQLSTLDDRSSERGPGNPQHPRS